MFRPSITFIVDKYRGEHASTRGELLKDTWRFPSNHYCRMFEDEARRYGYNIWASLDTAGLIEDG